jgi:hypothetical protein
MPVKAAMAVLLRDYENMQKAYQSFDKRTNAKLWRITRTNSLAVSIIGRPIFPSGGASQQIISCSAVFWSVVSLDLDRPFGLST